MQVSFLPYYQESLINRYKRFLESDVVISSFPVLARNSIQELRAKGVKVLAYVSIYKAPLIRELEPNTKFSGGSPAKEEVEINPFWKAIAITGDGHEVTTDQYGGLVRPFGKADYKKGWYHQCVFRYGLESKIEKGISGMLEVTDGVFVDNVIPHKVCYGNGCRGYGKPTEWTQAKFLSMIYDEVKSADRRNLVFLNTGRAYLLDPRVKADVYVTENFCYGETKPSGFWFAGKDQRSDENLFEEIRKIKAGLDSEGIQLLGYTKVGKDRNDAAECLRRSRDIAERFGIMWTTTLRGMEIMG